MLLREKTGRRFSYQSARRRVTGCSPAWPATPWRRFSGRAATSLRPVVSFFVDAVQREDRDVLDALDALVRERRAAEEDVP